MAQVFKSAGYACHAVGKVSDWFSWPDSHRLSVSVAYQLWARVVS